MSFDPNNLNIYPQEPGVYLMKDSSNAIIYIGKAKNLRARLKQYFGTIKDKRQMVPYLTAQVHSIDTIIALTEKDALILENTLIKKHKPKYNVLLKDDKTFISLMLTNHKWPMLKLVRYKGMPKDDGLYFGPYTNAFSARQMYDILCKLFPLRQCSDHELTNRIRPCLLYDIKRCIAPCCNLCTESQYKEHVQNATALLKGKDKDLLKELELQMQKASDDLLFEKAQEVKNLIDQIKNSNQSQLLDNPQAKDCDAIGLHVEGDATMLALLFFRNGKLIGSEHFSFHFIASSEEEILSSFLLQHYKNQNQFPKEILLPVALEEAETIQEIINEISPHKVSLQYPKLGRKDLLIEMAQKNAKALFIQEQDAKTHKEKILLELSEILHLKRYPKQIQCVDTSNISGSDPVASIVTYIDGQLEPKKGKLFSIKSAEKADDYTAMKEVLFRHLSKSKDNNQFCDLLILDGGKGQLNLAISMMQELSIVNIDVIALTKEDARHDKGLTKEKIFIPYAEEPIFLDPRSSTLFFLQKVRDSAHKKAIEYHRKKRSKRLFSSELDTIQGIGALKKQRLYQTFGSLKAIKSATREELEKVKGLTKKDIDLLTSIFNIDA